MAEAVAELNPFDDLGEVDAVAVAIHDRKPTLRTISDPILSHGRTTSAKPSLAMWPGMPQTTLDD